jgi:hypothetical protein
MRGQTQKSTQRVVTLVAATALAIGGAALIARAAERIFEGKEAYGDYTRDAPGIWHKVALADMPPPFATEAVGNPPKLAPRPAGALPQVLPGFSVTAFAEGFTQPRQMKIAPNGDIFLAESGAGKIHVIRAAAGATKAASDDVFAEVAERPYGIAFFPPGPNPEWVYVASMNQMVRFPYHVGDRRRRSCPIFLVASIGRAMWWWHRTASICSSPSARAATSATTAWQPSSSAPTFSNSTPMAAAVASLPRARATP